MVSVASILPIVAGKQTQIIRKQTGVAAFQSSKNPCQPDPTPRAALCQYRANVCVCYGNIKIPRFLGKKGARGFKLIKQKRDLLLRFTGTSPPPSLREGHSLGPPLCAGLSSGFAIYCPWDLEQVFHLTRHLFPSHHMRTIIGATREGRCEG